MAKSSPKLCSQFLESSEIARNHPAVSPPQFSALREEQLFEEDMTRWQSFVSRMDANAVAAVVAAGLTKANKDVPGGSLAETATANRGIARKPLASSLRQTPLKNPAAGVSEGA